MNTSTRSAIILCTSCTGLRSPPSAPPFVARKPRTPPSERPPIATARLKRISKRLHARLEEETTLPFPAVQYGLSEVGRTFDRFDPRELRVGLHVLANNERPVDDLPRGPWEPRSAIYVNATITKRNARHAASIAAATKEDQLRALSDTCRANRALVMAQSIAPAVRGKTEIEETDETGSEHLGGDVHWRASGARLHVAGRGHSPDALIWITNDISWLFPDDPRLWAALVDAERVGQRLIVLARKIAFSTFPLLKRLGGFGLQVHHLYMPDGPPEAPVARRALDNGPPMYEVADILGHKAIKENLPAALKKLPETSDEVLEGVNLAAEMGLNAVSAERTELLRKWTGQAKVAMPPPWKAQLTRYAAWDSVIRAKKGA